MRLRRQIVDQLSTTWMMVMVALLVVLPFAIGAGLLFKSADLFNKFSIGHLLFSSEWSPMQGHFGFRSFIVGSVWVTVLSFVISAPICLLSALYITQYAKKWVLEYMHPVIDILSPFRRWCMACGGSLRLCRLSAHTLLRLSASRPWATRS